MLRRIPALGASRVSVVVAVSVFVLFALAATAGALGRADLEREHASQTAHAERLLTTMGGSYASELARAADIAAAGTAAQANMLGLTAVTAPPGVAHATPSKALSTLRARYGATWTADEVRAVRQLDSLAEPLRGALTRFVDAFLAFEAATRAADDRADESRIAVLREIAASSDPAAAWRSSAAPGAAPWQALVDAGVAVGPVLAARTALADAALAVETALAVPAVPAVPRPFVNLCPVFAIELAGTATRYAKDCALILDVGGNDVYRNNGGGAPTGGGVGDVPFLSLVAALVDLAGNDRYGDPYRPRRLGANGGSSFLFIPMTAGFLLDAAGSDQYVAAEYGVNGGGAAGGFGYLVDAGGNDSYTAAAGGINGGGHFFGTGFLVDVGGDDVFTAGSGGANGGGLLGTGTLLSVEGRDAYRGGGGGVNGGALLGRGLLVDRGGNDSYTSPSYGGVNGGGDFGVGLLLDQGGTDTYSDKDRTTDGTFRCSGSGTNRTVAPKCLIGAQVDVP